MGQDFEDFEDARQRAFTALRSRFDIAGYSMFDEKFEVVPNLKGARMKSLGGAAIKCHSN
jgi:hypothetical protein